MERLPKWWSLWRYWRSLMVLFKLSDASTVRRQTTEKKTHWSSAAALSDFRSVTFSSDRSHEHSVSPTLSCASEKGCKEHKQNRTDYKLSTICHNIFSDSSPACLSISYDCTLLPGSFVLLQTDGYFVSPTLNSNLSDAVSLTVLQSDGILCLLAPVSFNSLVPSKLR